MDSTLTNYQVDSLRTGFVPRVFISQDYATLCESVASRIAGLIRKKPNAVLGLATGSTPIGVYNLLACMHLEDNLDFTNVRCFNLDEYYPVEPDSSHSYHYFMERHLFSKINCKQWKVPNGRKRDACSILADCRRYEAAIRDAGGIDLQLLGIGRNGHIGFNEPGSPSDSRTRLVDLDSITRTDASKDFPDPNDVPHQAVTMGIGTILEAREVILLAKGVKKAASVSDALLGEITLSNPASLLRTHPNVSYFLDQGSASLL